MAVFTLKIKLNSWKDFQEYRGIESISKLVDLLHNLLGARLYDNRLIVGSEEGSKAIGFSSGAEVKIIPENDSGNFLQEIQADIQKKNSDEQSFLSFLKKIFNPFRWFRHGLTFAALATAMGIGLSFALPTLLVPVLAALLAVVVGVGFFFLRPALLGAVLAPFLAIVIAIGFSFLKPDVLGAVMPALAGITALGITIGLPMLILMGLIEIILDYQQAKKDLYEHCYLGKYIIFADYGFFNYLADVIRYWHKHHPGQATMIGFGAVFFITALVLTIPYCVDPAGVFSFMSTVLDPIVRFISQAIDALVAMPYLDFLNVLHEPMIELCIAAGLFISSTLAIPLTLKNLIQGGTEINEAAHCYEEDAIRFQLNDDDMRNNPAFFNVLNHCIHPGSAYYDKTIDFAYQRDRELVMR